MPTGRRLLVWLGVALALSVTVVSAITGDLIGVVAGVLMATLLLFWNRPAPR